MRQPSSTVIRIPAGTYNLTLTTGSACRNTRCGGGTINASRFDRVSRLTPWRAWLPSQTNSPTGTAEGSEIR